MCNKQTGNNNEDLERRIEELENTIKNGSVVQSVNVSERNQTLTSNIQQPAFSKIENQKSVTYASKTKTTVSSIKQGPISKEWPNVLNDLKSNGKIMLYTNLINTNAVELNDMTIGIEFPNGINSFGKTVLEKSENRTELEKQVSIVCGKTMNVKYIDLKENSNQAQSNSVEDMISVLDIPFNVID